MKLLVILIGATIIGGTAVLKTVEAMNAATSVMVDAQQLAHRP